jgi:hypothetical protein
MISEMSQREKMLAFLVGGAVAVLLNVFLIKFFRDKFNDYRSEKAVAEAKMDGFRRQEAERDRWSKRDAWLTQQLTAMGDPDVANKRQREWLQETAKQNQILIESFSPGSPSPQPYYTSLGNRFDCKGKWDDMGRFIIDLQGPLSFIAIEGLDLKVDPSDKTQLRATLTVAKWFAPKS